MEIEQFKLLMEALKEMGSAGHSAFVWWLVFDKALPILGWLLTFSGIVWIIHRIIRATVLSTLGVKIRDILRIGSPGELTPAEAELVLLRVRELLDKEKK